MLRLYKEDGDKDVEVNVFSLAHSREMFLACLSEIMMKYIQDRQKNVLVYNDEGYMYINPHIMNIDRREIRKNEAYIVEFYIYYSDVQCESCVCGSLQTIMHFFHDVVGERYHSEEYCIISFKLNKHFIRSYRNHLPF